jgi:dihydroorotate dehydrogenase (fumarate)
MDLNTTYLGLPLKSPIIVGSSGLTNSVEKIKKIEQNGAGAVVVKSIFEEEIAFEYEDVVKEAESAGVNTDQFDYYDYHLRGKKLNGYIDLIQGAKKTVAIPIIASVNCVYSHEWVAFARQLQDAGADAIELNMFFLPSDLSRSNEALDRMYFDVIEKVLKTVSVPVALKISYYFSNLGQMIQKLSRTGVSGLVLFNRFFSPDFDIEALKVKPSFVFSTPADLAISLRWVAMMTQRVDCELAASTGVHDGSAVIKQLLAGAQAVQVVSVLYQKGVEYLQEMTAALKTWMTDHQYSRLSDFRGKLSQAEADNPAAFERVQFMKYFS